MSKERIFADGFFYKEKDTQFGPIPKLAFNVEKFTAFLNEHVDDKGYVRVDVFKRKEPDGDKTHYGVLDTYVNKQQSEAAVGKSQKPVKAQKPAEKKPKPFEEEDDQSGW